MTLVDAIVTAGGIPKPDEPLYPYTQGKPKALVDLAGKPMIQWILDALGEAQTIRRVVVVGLTDAGTALTCRKTLGYLPSQGSLVDNITAGARWVLGQDASATHALVVSSDVPTITPDVVNWHVETPLQTDHEVYYSVIPQDRMERRFPGSKRSYFHFTDGTFTAGDMNMVATRVVTHVPPQIQALVEARKNIFKQAAIIGFDTLLLLALRQLSLAQTEQMVSRRLGLKGHVLVCPHAEAGMDVDKPAQYELVRRDLEARQTV